MSKPRRYVLLWVATLPNDIIASILVLFFWAVWGHKLRWIYGVWCELKETSWPVRTWYSEYGGTTFGHGGILGPGYSGGKGIDTLVERHEDVHVEQHEVAMLVAFLSAGAALAVLLQHPFSFWTWVLPLAVWCSGWPVYLISSWTVAFLRGEAVYRGSSHEEAAYAMVEKYLNHKEGTR